MLMTSAQELLLVFIGLEISSISTYILAGFRKHTAKGPESALKYFLLGSFATAFFLYGTALIFGATGTTQIVAIAQRLGATTTPMLATLGMSMILIGLGFKVSAAPFHVWTPDAYEAAPSPVVGMMSTAPKAAAFAVLLRILYVAFPTLHAHWVPLIWVMAALSMTIGNLAALRQQNVKRMLAYSSIANAGYLLVAFTSLSADGIAAASFYSVTYAAMNVGIFAIISHAGQYEDKLTLISDYRGLGYRSPLLGGAMAFFLVSLIGIPFTGGFFRQVLCLPGGDPLGDGLAGDHRPIEQRRCGLLLSAPAGCGVRQATGEHAHAAHTTGAVFAADRDRADCFCHADFGDCAGADSGCGAGGGIYAAVRGGACCAGNG